jgi:hypothetical protein
LPKNAEKYKPYVKIFKKIVLLYELEGVVYKEQ